MDAERDRIEAFLATRHPYDALDRARLARIAGEAVVRTYPAGAGIYALDAPMEGLHLIETGQIEIVDRGGETVSVLGPGNSFGERGLLRGGRAVTGARAREAARILILPRASFDRLMAESPDFARFFTRGRLERAPATAEASDVSILRVGDFMTREPATVAPDATVAEAAAMMRARGISCVMALEGGALAGILTARDLTNRVVAEGRPGDTPVSEVMTRAPHVLSPDDLGMDAVLAMAERRIGHLPVLDGARLVGVVTQTDLVRWQALSASSMISDMMGRDTAEALAEVVGRIPRLLAQLVGSGARHEVVTRLITDVGDAATRRLLALAEAKLGPPPVPYLWLACGSQGRREQTGVSDQDNCLILDDSATAEHDAYFAALATFVSDGLDRCGYYYCPGDMMATNPRWRQPLRVWRDYFAGWVAKPDPEAQMLASVMFDLRPIGGATALFEGLRRETLDRARRNSIFVAHMVSNSLKHTVPLGLFRGFALIRSGEHKNALDLKLNGVVPVVDLGRIYALQAALEQVNTRERLKAAIEAGAVSRSGGADLIDAYDLIAETRLRHQAGQVRRGEKPDNFMSPSVLSELERSHLRDAFVVIKTMQSAAGQGKGMLT